MKNRKKLVTFELTEINNSPSNPSPCLPDKTIRSSNVCSGVSLVNRKKFSGTLYVAHAINSS